MAARRARTGPGMTPRDTRKMEEKSSPNRTYNVEWPVGCEIVGILAPDLGAFDRTTGNKVYKRFDGGSESYDESVPGV